jgi:hypothetical protein
MGPLTAAFVPHGGARTFAALARALSQSTLPNPDIGTHFVFEKCILILSQMFESPSGHKLLAEALECGLLAALVCGAKSPFADKVFDQSFILVG